jgi:uncharacterized LabA/DUF88 family protein
MRIAIVVDGNNIFYVCRRMGFSIDYAKLTNYLEEVFGGQVIIRKFFTGAPDTPNEGQEKFWRRLRAVGYDIIKREIKTITNQEGGHIKEKADVDASIGFMIADLQSGFDILVLLSGDGDYSMIIEELSKRGKRIVIMSTYGVVSSELRDLSHISHSNIQFIDIADIKNEIYHKKMEVANE